MPYLTFLDKILVTSFVTLFLAGMSLQIHNILVVENYIVFLLSKKGNKDAIGNISAESNNSLELIDNISLGLFPLGFIFVNAAMVLKLQIKR